MNDDSWFIKLFCYAMSIFFTILSFSMIFNKNGSDEQIISGIIWLIPAIAGWSTIISSNKEDRLEEKKIKENNTALLKSKTVQNKSTEYKIEKYATLNTKPEHNIKAPVKFEKSYYFLLVEYEDEQYGRTYYFISDDTSIKVGDSVNVQNDKTGVRTVVVKKVGYYSAQNAPYPVNKVKKIIGRFNLEDIQIKEKIAKKNNIKNCFNENILLSYITNYASVDLLNEETKIYADFLNKKDEFNVSYKKLINIYYNQYRSVDYDKLYDYSNTANEWGDEMPTDLNYIMQQLAAPIKRSGDYKISHEIYKYLIVTYGLKYDLLFSAWYKVLVSAMMFEPGSIVLVSGVNMFNNAFLIHRKYPYRGEFGPTTCQQHAIRLETVLKKEKWQHLNNSMLNYLKIASGTYSSEIKEQLTKSDESIFIYLKNLSGNANYEMNEIDLDYYDKFSALNYRTPKMQNFTDYFS